MRRQMSHGLRVPLGSTPSRQFDPLPMAGRGSNFATVRDSLPIGWLSLLPSHSLDKTRSTQHQFIFPVLARSGGIVSGIRERGVVTNIG